MKKVLLFLLFVLSSLQLSAAVGRGYVSVYKTDGTVDSIAVNGIYNITHSRMDLDGKEHADYVTMVVTTNDNEWKYLISNIKQVFLPDLEYIPLTLGGGINEKKSGPRRITFNGTFPFTIVFPSLKLSLSISMMLPDVRFSNVLTDLFGNFTISHSSSMRRDV